MDTLTFIAKLVEALAWPTVVVIAICVFKSPIAKLIEKLRKLTWKSGGAEFAEALKEVENEAARANLPALKEANRLPPSKVQEALEELRILATVSPQAAVFVGWKMVEVACEHLYEKYTGHLPRDKDEMFEKVTRLLNTQGANQNVKGFATNLPHIFMNLRALRNQGMNESSRAILPADAVRFGELALRFAETIMDWADSIKPESPDSGGTPG